MLNEAYDDIEKRMQAAIQNLQKNFRGMRTGRATTALLDK